MTVDELKAQSPAMIDAVGNFIRNTGFPIALCIMIFWWVGSFLTPRLENAFTKQGELVETVEDSIKTQEQTLKVLTETIQGNRAISTGLVERVQDVHNDVQQVKSDVKILVSDRSRP